MAEKSSSSLINEPNNSHFSQQSLSPPRMDNSRSQQSFTPRSSTFPDDSDSEFDFIEHTPIHSPGGPDYEDLPPSYEQAQAQALEQSRGGRPTPNPNDLQVHRLVLDPVPDPDYPVAPPPQIQPRNAYPLQNGAGLGSTVPVTEISGSTAIPVHRFPSSPTDPSAVLLKRALDFTQYGPDADLQHAPRLTRIIAIPQEVSISTSINPRSNTTGHGSHGRQAPFARGGPRGRRGSPRQHHWGPPDRSSANPTEGFESSRTQFLRTYAKALHTHSIRPAEFASFLDGLNVLCNATVATPEALLPSSSKAASSSTTTAPLIESYIAACNSKFFAPRGLRIRLASLFSLISTLNIPTDRGQQAAAVASALDQSTSSSQHADALYPWIERLEPDPPEPSSSMMALRAMGEHIKAQAAPSSSMDGADIGGAHVTGVHRTATAPNPPPWGRGPGGFSPWDGRGGMPFGSGRGRMPWAGRGGMPGGGRGGMHRGSGHGFGPQFPWAGQQRGGGHERSGDQSWEEWGEEIGKRFEVWGESFGKMAESWGENIGKKAGAWGEEIGRKASGESSRPRGHASNSEMGQWEVPLVDISDPIPRTEPGQESGIVGHEAPEAHPIEPEDDDDDSSDSDSDSSFSSDDDDDDFEDPQDQFIDRVREINGKAASAAEKGKKSPDEIARERDAAIEKAQSQRTAMELKIEEKREKRTLKRELRAKKREIKKEIRMKKREFKAAGKPDREERRRMKEEWSAKRREHKQLKQEMRKEWRDKRREKKWDRKGPWTSGQDEDAKKMVWIVVENLDD